LFPTFVENRLMGVLEVIPERFRERIQGLVRGFLSGTGSTRRPSVVLLLVLYTFCEWLIIVGCFLCIFKAIPVTENLGLLDTLIVVGFVAFGSAVQIPGIGGGMQVATVLVLTELFHIPLESASGIAILIWAVTFVSVVPIGLALAVRDGLEWRKLVNVKEMKTL
jgi:glycosyltransferase 2 family protein